MATTHSLTLSGLKSVDDVNRVTTALMAVDGVDSVEVAREWAHVEGRARMDKLIRAVETAGFRVHRG